MERLKKLASNILDYSISLKKGEKVMISASDVPDEVVAFFVNEIAQRGGIAIVKNNNALIKKALIVNATSESCAFMQKHDLALMKEMDAWIGIHGSKNLFELADIPSDKMRLFVTEYQDSITEQRVKNTKWVLLNFPTPAIAQAAKMSLKQYEDFYYNVCCMNYEKMSKAMDKLVALMEKTDKVRLIAPGTDLTFSIKGIPAIKCDGKMNIPDGEVFTAPIRDSVNGTIAYNMPSLYNGTHFSGIKLEVKNGKIIFATAAENSDKLNEILNTDEGARYFGEFAFGVNPHIKRAFEDILFDEKISGSIHLTPGSCYKNEAPNGNESAIHWDMVLSFLPQHGGGEIYFDDVLIRKDGLFVMSELKCLNPENLL